MPAPLTPFAPSGARTRGIYCTLPRGEEEPAEARLPLNKQPGGHFDSGVTDDSMTYQRFMVTGLIDDTPPGCGGFTLYPRSHTRLYDLALRTRQDGLAPASAEAKERLAALVAEIDADTEPVDCCGPEGTVVLWHRATMHTVAANYTEPPAIRQGIIYDFLSAQPLGDGRQWDGEDGERLQVPWLGPGPGVWDGWAAAVRSPACARM